MDNAIDKATSKPATKPTPAPGVARTGFGTIVMVVALLGILAGASWYAAQAWLSVDGPPMPATGYVAMTLGVVFSLLVGFALMALLFYSNRHGYDDRAAHEQSGDLNDSDRH